MDREAVLVVLALLTAGPSVLVVGSASSGVRETEDGRALERRAWRVLLLPLAPAALALSALAGWALVEPDDSERLPVALVAACAPIALVWVRALIRAARALRAARRKAPDVPAATFGLLRPRVVIASWFADRLDAAALEAAKEHEAAHARHRDPLRLLIAQLVTDIQGPSPAARRRLAAWVEALELARDEEARARGADGADLAAAVLEAAGAARDTMVCAIVSPGAAALKRRVARLLAPLPESSEGDAFPGGPLVAGISLAALVGACFGEAVVRALTGA